MKKSSVNLLTLFLSLLMILALFSSCGEETVTPADTTGLDSAVVSTAGDEKTEDTAVLPSLPDTVWNREFRILGCGETKSDSFPSFELYASELTGDAMNDAVYTRNETVRGKYGITVVQTLEKDTHERIAREYSSGEDNFDLVFVYINKVGALAQKGYFLDLNDVDNIDFSKPWWNSEVNDIVSIKGHVFYTSSDFALRDKNRIQVMEINDKLSGELKLESVPGLVRSGKWTADKMLELVTAAAADLNGDGKHTADDRYGLVMGSYDCFAGLCFGCGVRLVDKDENDTLAIVSDNGRDSEAVDKVLAICNKELSMTPEDYGKNWDINSDTFVAGRALFSVNTLAFVGYYNQNCDFDFTVCPFPKLNEDQAKYYTIPDVGCMLFAVPVTCKDSAFSGFALEAFSYASTDTTCVTFVDVICKARNVRNADSVEMINLIFDGVVYDSSIFYSDSIMLYSILNKTIPSLNRNTFITNMTSIRKSAGNTIAKINESFAD